MARIFGIIAQEKKKGDVIFMFTLSTDTSCDVMRDELDKLGIPWVPLTFTINGETFPDDFTRDEQYKDFYAKVRAGAMPTTSQITAFTHEEYFEKLVAGGAKDIVHLTLSGGLSATYQSACLGAKAVAERHPDVKINIVDTLCATQVHHMVLDDALELRNKGLGGSEAAKLLNEETKKIHVWIIVDDLKHLRRGGRVSGVAAAIGTLLNIKSMIVFDKEGKLKVMHKAKGFKKALDYVLEYMDEWAPNADTVYMAHADAVEKAEEMKALIKSKRPNCDVRYGWCGPVIGAHTGAGMLGIIFKSEKERPQ